MDLVPRLPRDILSWFYDIVLGDTMGFVSVLPELKINRKCIAKVMSLIHVKPYSYSIDRAKLFFSASKYIFYETWEFLDFWKILRFLKILETLETSQVH